MDKPKLNFVIDALMFLTLMAIAGLGFLMKYVLIPGKDTWAVYGRHVELYLFGMDRHDWGAIHLYLAFFLLTLLVIHLILHWSMIVGLFARLISSTKLRTRIAFAFLIITVLLLYFPFLFTPEIRERGPGGGRGEGRGWGAGQRGEGLPRSRQMPEPGASSRHYPQGAIDLSSYKALTAGGIKIVSPSAHQRESRAAPAAE
jgi:hypothetical protein